jgi:hypothetical protein
LIAGRGWWIARLILGLLEFIDLPPASAKPEWRRVNALGFHGILNLP